MQLTTLKWCLFGFLNYYIVVRIILLISIVDAVGNDALAYSDATRFPYKTKKLVSINLEMRLVRCGKKINLSVAQYLLSNTQ